MDLYLMINGIFYLVVLILFCIKYLVQSYIDHKEFKKMLDSIEKRHKLKHTEAMKRAIYLTAPMIIELLQKHKQSQKCN